MKKFVKFFDRLENITREHLSKHPITYSIIGGIFVVLFWRGVWHSADIVSHVNPFFSWFFYPPIQVVVSVLVLMLTGLMVSVFIGDRIILSGLRHEKKLEERTEELVKEEVITLEHVHEEIKQLRREINNLKNK